MLPLLLVAAPADSTERFSPSKPSAVMLPLGGLLRCCVVCMAALLDGKTALLNLLRG